MPLPSQVDEEIPPHELYSDLWYEKYPPGTFPPTEREKEESKVKLNFLMIYLLAFALTVMLDMVFC